MIKAGVRGRNNAKKYNVHSFAGRYFPAFRLGDISRWKVNAGSGNSCQILQVFGDFTGPLGEDVSKQMGRLQCGMCLGLFPSCVNTVQPKNAPIWVGWLHSEMCAAPSAAAKGGSFSGKKIDTRVVLVLRLNQRGRKMEI